jgi:hypothetical protein
MPRIGRLHISGGCYHVIGRGLERRNIFATVDDKEDFLVRLGLSLKKMMLYVMSGQSCLTTTLC